jgi:hypothetical protein
MAARLIANAARASSARSSDSAATSRTMASVSAAPYYAQRVRSPRNLSPWAFLWVLLPALLLIGGLIVLYVYLVYGNLD